MSTSAIPDADRLWLKRLIANAPGLSLIDNNRAQGLLDGISAPAPQADEWRECECFTDLQCGDARDCTLKGNQPERPDSSDVKDSLTTAPAPQAAEAPITDADINAHLARLYAARGREMPESERVSRAPAPQAAEPRGCPIPGACAGVPAIAAAVEAMRQRAEKAERELAIIKAMAATGTAQSFLSTDDETKRFVFALATEESRRRKIAETALLPFARAAEQVDKRIADHARLGMGAMSGEASIGLGIKFKHILAARAALDGPATEGDGK